MPTEKKIAQVAELEERFDRSSIVILTEFRGLSVADMNAMRRRMRDAGVEFKVAKNTLTKIAADRKDRSALGEWLVGPTAIAFGYEEPTAAAKAVSDAARGSRNALTIKGGVLGTAPLSTAQLEDLANLPSREILLGRVLSGIQSPTYRLVGVLNASLRNLASVLDQRAQQMGPA
jgi:large subunit ribosomal protein L10